MKLWTLLVPVIGVAACSNSTPKTLHASVVRLDAEPNGTNCGHGGTAVRAGLDANDNGTLEDSEVGQTRYVCNGADGANGQNGQNGADGAAGTNGTNGTDGKNALLPVTHLTASASATSVTLTWVNPPAPFAGVTVRRSTSAFPESAADGTAVYEGPAATTTDSAVTAGTRYFYSVFAHDVASTFVEGVQASAVPQASGALDVTFNGSGFVAGDAPRGNNQTQGAGLVVDAQNRTVVVGFAQSLNGADLAVWRFNPDGSADRTFAGSGTLVLDSVAGGFKADSAYAVVADAEGRLYVGGSSYAGTTNNGDAVVLRLLPSGLLDSTWGNAGLVLLRDVTTTGAEDGVSGLVLDASGRLLVAGNSGNISSGPASLYVARLTPVGALDATFNGTGYRTIASLPSATSPYLLASGIALDATGRIVAAGTGYGPAASFDVGVFRLTNTGAFDTTFDTDGIVALHSVLGGLATTSLGVTTSGNKVLVIGYGQTTTAINNDAFVLRLAENGALDSTFGTNGVVSSGGVAGSATGIDVAAGIAVDGQGRIVVGGYSTNEASNADACLWRFTPTGALDTTFNGTGFRLMRDVGGGRGFDTVNDVAFDSLGRIMATGSSSWGGPEMVLWRFVP